MNLERFKTATPHPLKAVFKGYSNAKIADHLGIQSTYFSNIINGHIKPGAELSLKIEKLAAEFLKTPDA